MTGNTDVAVYDHLRSPDDSRTSDTPDGLSPGIYRVVGTAEGSVTLLRVGDADGRRVHTGEVVTVAREKLDRLDPAENPDGNRPAAAAIAGQIEAVGWSIRTFARSLLARPLPSLAAAALVVGGAVADGVVPLPEQAFTVAIIAGSLALAYLGAQGA